MFPPWVWVPGAEHPLRLGFRRPPARCRRRRLPGPEAAGPAPREGAQARPPWLQPGCRSLRLGGECRPAAVRPHPSYWSASWPMTAWRRDRRWNRRCRPVRPAGILAFGAAASVSRGGRCAARVLDAFEPWLELARMRSGRRAGGRHLNAWFPQNSFVFVEIEGRSLSGRWTTVPVGRLPRLPVAFLSRVKRPARPPARSCANGSTDVAAQGQQDSLPAGQPRSPLAWSGPAPEGWHR